MLSNIINYSLRHKFVVLLFVAGLIGFGIYALMNIPIGAVPDITNNQVQVISTSRNLPTEEVERYLTYPVELEMGNLPGVQEIRSISKFGLSVVTIVFDDDMGTYLPRQLISEKLKSIRDEIPEGFGSPFMGPISTGLGEIYQYILDVKPGYEDRYDVTDLRTIQDWIVKRQLSGVPGVVEVNTWGGFLKTYEVAVDPIRLKAMDITLSEVYAALQKNNTVAGGGYIEKSNEAYFIRAEGLAKSVEDLESIVVKLSDGTPIYIKDIATIGFGAATRFGAITGNGEGEKVLGQIMMLKGADSKKVIDAVIARVEEIQTTLPEGVFINPFLERSELIGKTTFTMTENLILGFLIVLFVVVFLLGNLRSGLVVASVIPLTLLFTLTLMYLFGVDANLMSLGAIDFGIIIDGAVIIVEYIAFKITQNAYSLKNLNVTDRKNKMDELVHQGANKMMNSAVFGQIIIIIVFIPILALTGVEGKMFKPMALTFCFALIGAMILCFTYVPVVASMFLKPSDPDKKTISTRFISLMKKWYEPALSLALNMKKVVLTLAVVVFVLTTILFTKMGGEFVPTLDEGDFVIQPVLKTGMSLAETVKMTTRIEQILKRFPEVKQVVSRIGAAEVPTDPMSMEESDVIITLEKKGLWTSAQSKDELADVFKDALIKEIPGIDIEFTQPIEMRFNELISGARADLAIKLFGEDLDVLYSKAMEIKAAIINVEGAADISVEKIDGLPQMSVKYNRAKIAKYGINIDQLNEVISMGFAGKTAGTIYEGESKFDIVLKYAKNHRNDIQHLKDALIDIPSGQQLPLSEFAEIEYSYGPAKISRDDTKRRIVVGVNVRGKDLQSVVDEVQILINEQVNIPDGYFLQYGGQFENLQKGSQRLMVAVPIALVLIFILLYFAFGSVKEALLIFSAIPLATIGGVLALYLRGMPFSISAGIGFIALFGIAVLNGIVMIEHFKELKTETVKDINKLIIKGAIDRLRPVLLTAFAAALGFLPMAISGNAGAEVQRPLATVVIGGLVSATFLTLIVLPVLYSMFLKRSNKKTITAITTISLLLLMAIPNIGQSQKPLTLDQAVDIALQNNKDYRAAQLDLDRQEVLLKTSKVVNKTDFRYEWDQNNTDEYGDLLHTIGLSHAFKLPKVHQSKKEYHQALIQQQNQELLLIKLDIEGQVTALYNEIIYLQSLEYIYKEVNGIYENFLSTSEKKFNLGESNIMEKMTASQRKNEWQDQQNELSWQTQQAYYNLQETMQSNQAFEIVANTQYELMEIREDNKYYQQSLALQQSHIDAVTQSKEMNFTDRLPEISTSIFSGFNNSNQLNIYPGVELGVSLALSQKKYKAQRNADLIQMDVQRLAYDQTKGQMDRNKERLMTKKEYLNNRMVSYNKTILMPSASLLVTAQKALKSQEITYFEYLLLVENALDAKIKYLDLQHEYNQTIISLNYQLK